MLFVSSKFVLRSYIYML